MNEEDKYYDIFVNTLLYCFPRKVSCFNSYSNLKIFQIHTFQVPISAQE